MKKYHWVGRYMDKSYKQYKEVFSQNFSIQYKESVNSSQKTYHIHDVLEIVLVRSDGVVTMVDDQEFPVKKDTLLIFNHRDLHFNKVSYLDQPYCRYVVYFAPEFVDGLSTAQTNLLECFYFRTFPVPWIIPLTQKKSDEFSALLDEIINSARQDQVYGSELYTRLLLGEFLLKVNLEYRDYHHINTQDNTIKYNQIYQIMDYIHKHYAEDLNLDLLSKQFFISKFQLCKLFKEVTGMSPNQYLIHCRLIKAKELLIEGILVENVCELTGYNNLAHFSRSFKKNVGKSPKQFQLINKK